MEESQRHLMEVIQVFSDSRESVVDEEQLLASLGHRADVVVVGMVIQEHLEVQDFKEAWEGMDLIRMLLEGVVEGWEVLEEVRKGVRDETGALEASMAVQVFNIL